MSDQKKRGFTLIEVVVAAAFLGVVIVALNSLFLGVKQINVSTNNYTIASAVAQQVIEQYRNEPYSNIVVGTTDITSTALAAYPSLQTPRSATVTTTLANANGIKQVDVAVIWQAQTGSKKVELTTQIANIGLNH